MRRASVRGRGVRREKLIIVAEATSCRNAQYAVRGVARIATLGPCPAGASSATMKFQLSAPSGNVVTGHGPGWVRVGMTEYRENLVLTAEAVTPGWVPGGFDALG